ncbi:MAG: T9SS type A sorting domain-containing protein [Saprospiraceae bacterium]
MYRLLLLITFLFSTILVQSQATFNIHLESFNINGFTGIQSFAFGQHNSKILLIGGRKDGLHRRQPWASFDAAGNNTDILVIDPETEQIWAASVNTLSTSLKEQLQSTNMQFYQDGNTLYIIGGYGFSTSNNDHITHPQLTAIQLDACIDAIINGTSIASHFRQFTNDYFAVTGGQIGKLDDTYYLAGGQKFTGRYNPMNGPSFVQEYTNSIKRFKIIDDGTNLNYQPLASWTDAMNLHRRDYNMLPQIFPNGSYGFTMFSGVFQHAVDLPFLNSVDFDSTGYQVNNSFSQFLNHYHSAKIAVYDSTNKAMHNVFFGGIARYFLDDNGNLVQDDDVPFVKTIGRVSRFVDSTMTETQIGSMPDLLGAGAEFILAENTPQFDYDIVDLQQLTSDTVLIGYILGGIKSSQPNIFFTNTGNESEAYSTLYKVYLIPSGITNTKVVQQKEYLSNWSVFPNPAVDYFKFKLDLKESAIVDAYLSDVSGEIILETGLDRLSAGSHEFTIELEAPESGIYFMSILVNGRLYTKQIIVK